MATYSGNIFGNRATYVFSSTGGTNANFVGTIAVGGNTLAYVNAGGSTFAAGASLSQFVGNQAYLQFRRSVKDTITQILPEGGITFETKDVTPDPRITIGFVVGEGITGHHMDEIHYTAAGGVTFQAFLGRITYSAGHTDGGSTLISAGHALLDLVAPGISGGGILNSFTKAYQLSAGGTVVNKTNGMSDTGCTITNVTIFNRVPVKEYRDIVLGQVAGNSDNNRLSSGLTGITIGGAGVVRHVRINPRSKDLMSFIGETSHIISNAITGDSDRQGSVYIPFGVSGADGTSFGVSLNAVTGGTVSGTSLFEEFVVRTANKKVELDNAIQTTTQSMLDATTVRGIDEVSF